MPIGRIKLPHDPKGDSITESFLLALCGLLGAGFLGLLIPVLTGGLVPVSRVEAAEADAQRWKEAHNKLHEAHEIQTHTLERAQLTAEITDKVMAGIQSTMSRPLKVDPNG